MNRESDIPVQVLRELVRYDAETGRLFWAPRPSKYFRVQSYHTADHSAAKWNSRYAGREAFAQKHPNGYLGGGLFKVRLMAHRVCWAVHCGAWPSGVIDHINFNTADNRIANLRDVSHSQNMRRRRGNSVAASRFKGVFRGTSSPNKWVAGITVNKRFIHLGTFTHERAAAVAYDRAAREHFGSDAYCNSDAPDWIAVTLDKLESGDWP